MKTTLLYKTDHNHSFKSRDLIGVFTNKTSLEKSARSIINQDIRDNGEQESRSEEERVQMQWNFAFLFEKKQTQGLPSFELVIESVETNTIF